MGSSSFARSDAVSKLKWHQKQFGLHIYCSHAWLLAPSTNKRNSLMRLQSTCMGIQRHLCIKGKIQGVRGWLRIEGNGIWRGRRRALVLFLCKLKFVSYVLGLLLAAASVARTQCIVGTSASLHAAKRALCHCGGVNAHATYSFCMRFWPCIWNHSVASIFGDVLLGCAPNLGASLASCDLCFFTVPRAMLHFIWVKCNIVTHRYFVQPDLAAPVQHYFCCHTLVCSKCM